MTPLNEVSWLDFIGSEAFWIGLLQIIWIDIILSGDNALVIALAVRSLPSAQRRLGIILGVGAAIVLRILFAGAIVYILEIPLLKLIGSALLMWIAIKLILPEGDQPHGTGAAASSSRSGLWSVIRTVVIADAVMSLDNVISVAAAAKGSVFLLSLGIAISIPLMMVGSQMMVWALDRFPWLMIAGGGLLGWIAGELAVHDPIAHAWVAETMPALLIAAPFIGCGIVVAIGLWASYRPRRPQPVEALSMDGGGDKERQT
jgi:YjbE family integral membrane protein